MEKVPRIKELKSKPLLDGKDKSILNNFDTTIFYLRIIKQAKHIYTTTEINQSLRIITIKGLPV